MGTEGRYNDGMDALGVRFSKITYRHKLFLRL